MDGATRRGGVRAWSVRTRILAATLVIAAVGMTLAGATAYLVQRERHLREIDERLLASVQAARFVLTGEGTAVDGETAVAAPAAPIAATTSDQALEAVLARVVPSRFESSVGIVDGAPRWLPIVEVPFHLEDDRALIERVVAEVADGSVRLGTAVSPLGNLRYIAAPVSVAGDASTGVFLTAVDVDAELAELGTAFRTYAIVAVGALLAIALVGWYVAGRLLDPIRALRSTASRITATDLGERIPVTGHDDVSALTRTVNDMLDRLETALTSQRQLLDDVRHELGTPLTIVRGHLELLDPADEREVRATRALAMDELDRMSRLVSDIQTLADSDRRVLDPVPTDVADLTAEVLAKVTAIPGHDWVAGPVAQVVAPLDAERITQAWLQLADNAAKYSPAGTPIVIGSTARPGEVELWVADRGPGVPADARERIFERFGRVETGRGVAGSGLGLPIADAIARGHGGRVTLESSPAGSRFGIAVPLPASASDPGTA